MELIANFPCFSIVLSLVSAAISAVAGQKWARRICLFILSLGLVMSAATLWLTATTGQNVFYIMGQVPAPWGNELRFGVLEPLFATLFSLITLLCVIGGENQLREKTHEHTRHLFYVMCDLIQASLFALCYTNDIFTGYVFIEICTIASCGVLIIRGTGRTTTAATRYMIFSLVGSSLFLLGVIMLYSVTGHLLMPQLKESVQAIWAAGDYQIPLRVIIVLLMGGLAIKSGLFPFHFWMADTYGCALPGSGGILSGIISKGYIFFLIKVIHNVIGTEVFYSSGVHNVLFVFGILGMIVGSISAIHSADIKHMIAYSSAAQIGYIYMGLGISPAAGTLAALFHILFHALTKPALFVSASRLSDVSGNSKKFVDLQGSAHRNLIAGLTFTVSAMSMVGLPVFMGFISKLLFASAGVQAGVKLVPTMVALAISTVLNVMYFLRTVIRIYTPAPERGGKAIRWWEQPPFTAVALCFVVLNICIGLVSEPVISLLNAGLAMLG